MDKAFNNFNTLIIYLNINKDSSLTDDSFLLGTCNGTKNNQIVQRI